jgi:hypothetical protein
MKFISKENLSAPITMLIAKILTTEPNLIEFLNPKNLIPEKIRQDIEIQVTKTDISVQSGKVKINNT